MTSHGVDLVHFGVRLDWHVILIERGYIRKGVMINGLWQEMRDKEGSQKESNKKEIR
jgi:hypothetical protein